MIKLGRLIAQIEKAEQAYIKTGDSKPMTEANEYAATEVMKQLDSPEQLARLIGLTQTALDQFAPDHWGEEAVDQAYEALREKNIQMLLATIRYAPEQQALDARRKLWSLGYVTDDSGEALESHAEADRLLYEHAPAFMKGFLTDPNKLDEDIIEIFDSRKQRGRDIE